MLAKKYLVLLLFLLGLLSVGVVSGQDQPHITEFRITPIGRTRLVRHPDLEYPVQFIENGLQFEVWATGGTVRFTQQFLDGSNYQTFGEFAGPEHSTPIITLWSSEPWEFCAENRGEGGWENADRVCTIIRVEIGYHCVAYAQGGFPGCEYEFEDYGPLTYYRPDGSTVQSAPQLEEDCGNALAPTIEVGQRGRVSFTNGDPTGLYDTPQGEVTVRMPEGTEFEVVGGPVCTVARNGHLWWSRLELDDGTTGWSAYGYIGTPYWIEPIAIEMPTGEMMTVNVPFEPWNVQYSLVFNPRTCTVLNGAEIVALEINRFENWMGSKSRADRYFAALDYFAVNGGGEVEQFRVASEAAIRASLNPQACNTLLYGVGTEHYMDMSGIGNIVFGYYMERYGFLEATEDGIAALTQAMNQYSVGQLVDNLDDSSQRNTGAVIYQLMVGVESLATEEIVTVAAEFAELY